MTPKKHQFSNSYLLTGIPIGWTGCSGGMISADEEKDITPLYWRLLTLKPYNPWYVVDGDAYLERGYASGGLQGKLKKFLQNQGLKHEDFPIAYLMTSSRFLGYQNNPVSIWNLYSREKELKAIILEVNNTFDERHTYFVTPKDIESQNTDDTGLSPRFENTWSKEFYVSPFNSRSGSYSIYTRDPFFPSLAGNNPLALTLTLKSAEQKILIARLFSVGAPIDPSNMTVIEKTRFILTWWWVGFATFPRTLVQAWKLFFKKKMPWVSRPEPLQGTISKHADVNEKYLECLFRRYLRHLVQNNDSAITLRYKPAGLLNNTEEVIYSPSAQMSPSTTKTLEITILTPTFYTHFVKYDSIRSSFEKESKNETIRCSQLALLSSLIYQSSRASEVELPWTTSFLFHIIYFLRLRSSSSVKHHTPTKSHILDRISHFDFYILTTSSASINNYCKTLVKILLSDFIALGWIEILDLEWFLVRCGILWWVAGKMGFFLPA